MTAGFKRLSPVGLTVAVVVWLGLACAPGGTAADPVSSVSGDSSSTDAAAPTVTSQTTTTDAPTTTEPPEPKQCPDIAVTGDEFVDEQARLRILDLDGTPLMEAALDAMPDRLVIPDADTFAVIGADQQRVAVNELATCQLRLVIENGFVHYFYRSTLVVISDNAVAVRHDVSTGEPLWERPPLLGHEGGSAVIDYNVEVAVETINDATDHTAYSIETGETIGRFSSRTPDAVDVLTGGRSPSNWDHDETGVYVYGDWGVERRTFTGSILWQRHDIGGVEGLHQPTSDAVVVTLDDETFVVLSPESGEELGSGDLLDGFDVVHFGEAVLAVGDRKARRIEYDGEVTARILHGSRRSDARWIRTEYLVVRNADGDLWEVYDTDLELVGEFEAAEEAMIEVSDNVVLIAEPIPE